MPIASKTFDVLVVLLEHRDHVVSKDELLNRVWPDTAVNENNLARQISSLRRVLGQRPDQHDFVVTVPGNGYRFVANVQNVRIGHRRLGTTPTDTCRPSLRSASTITAPTSLSAVRPSPPAQAPASRAPRPSDRWWRIPRNTGRHGLRSAGDRRPDAAAARG